MGLLDSVLGAVQSATQSPASGSSGGGLGGLLQAVTARPELLQAATDLLGNQGSTGGLGGLIGRFQQAGLGDVIGSWVGTGQNQPVSADQLTEVLGADRLSELAAKVGMEPDQVAGQLSSVLPGLIDHLTPSGSAPAGGLGNADELMGMLGGLFQRR